MTPEQLRSKWDEWCEAFLALKQHEMSDQLSRALISMTLNEGAGVPEQIAQSFPYRVFMAHAERIGLRVTPTVAAFMSIGVTEGNPGQCVMYVHALRYLQLKRGIEHIDMSTLSMEIFPMGFPAVDDMRELWDKQKGHTMGEPFDNMLDAIGGLA